MYNIGGFEHPNTLKGRVMIAMAPHKSRVLENQDVAPRHYNTKWWKQVGVEEPTLVIVLESVVAISLIIGLAALCMFL